MIGGSRGFADAPVRLPPPGTLSTFDDDTRFRLSL